ncbi:MAG: ferritin [Ignavibacteriales bacterium CG12_big_fil_rev_8_21_14_0_65_30_8]|nr:MAG: ferritin [Ignavibacteriales bacterium CG12_big_fil_rev_8_21_14_0_65_30_8]
MINPKTEKMLNKQLNDELYSSYFYLAMSAYFENNAFEGFAKWMRTQSEEERVHAMKIYDYIHRVGGKVKLTAIKTPQTEWANPLAVFKDTYKHECDVTKSINTIVEMAVNLKDHATNNFMQWFISEQVEEEATAQRLLDQLKFIGNDKQGLFMLDREMGQRTVNN